MSIMPLFTYPNLSPYSHGGHYSPSKFTSISVPREWGCHACPPLPHHRPGGPLVLQSPQAQPPSLLGFVVADTHLFQSEGAQQPLFWGEGSSRFVFDGGLQFCNLRGLRPASPTHTNQASAGISSMFQGKFQRDKQRQLRLKLKHEQ
jgi:hypothetical protein